MMKRAGNIVCAAAVMLAVASSVSAQTTAPGEVMFHWGPVHVASGQAVAINFALTEHFGGPLTLPVELQIENKDGAVIYGNAIDVAGGPALPLADGPGIPR